MKRQNSKQRLIGGIAILSVAVIVGIVITTNIVKNRQISSEKYATTTANGDSNLIANYIKEGITIGGITGKLEILNTFDATATAEDIAEGKVAYARGERIVGTYKTGPEPLSDNDLQISKTNVFYADLDSGGEITVDGVIFADLAGEEESGQWDNSQYDIPYDSSLGAYIIPKGTNLKQYYIKGEYTDEHFGTGKVIAPIEGTSGNDRFYVMALNDFDSSAHYWYYNAYGNLDTSYSVNTTANDFAAAGEEATGKLNTERMIASWNIGQYKAQNADDMWGLIQDEVANGWFVPSKSEWAAFGQTFDIDPNNYNSTFGLGGFYFWTSSQYSTDFAYRAAFGYGYIDYGRVYFAACIRLATTF